MRVNQAVAVSARQRPYDPGDERVGYKEMHLSNQEMQQPKEVLLNSPRSNWQERRNEFNHDWLKNVYMQALGNLIRVLDGRVIDHPFLETFLTTSFQE